MLLLMETWQKCLLVKSGLVFSKLFVLVFHYSQTFIYIFFDGSLN